MREVRLSRLSSETETSMTPFAKTGTIQISACYRFWKRTLDVAVAGTLLLLLAPAMLAIGCCVRLGSRGPALFRQTRMGRGFRPFQILKFRTMLVTAPATGGVLTVGDDPRVTSIGRTLRAWKLDELPQLWNVVLGDMSLVGPRPEVARFVELFRSDYETILSVRPGITDAASLRYYDEASELAAAKDPEQDYITRVLPEKIAIAKAYVRDTSLVTDLMILSQTALRVCSK
jgi:lipopolysaccharide/colanic/teichoic acid biosynthesis glycosyltransferase